MYGVINLSVLDTQPGGHGPFCPPEGWQGDYLTYLQERFDGDIGAKQQIVVVGRSLVRKSEGPKVEFIGPYAVDAREFAFSAWLSNSKR